MRQGGVRFVVVWQVRLGEVCCGRIRCGKLWQVEVRYGLLWQVRLGALRFCMVRCGFVWLVKAGELCRGELCCGLDGMLRQARYVTVRNGRSW